jgi:Serine carboxypeptidase S28
LERAGQHCRDHFLKIVDNVIIMLDLKKMLSLSLVSFYSLAAYSISLTYRHVNKQPPNLSKNYPEHKITIPFDHFHNESRYEPHTNETFDNSYWLDTSNYVNGGPIFVLAMGEDGVFDLPWLDHGLVQELASATGGVAVMWGQRYYAGNYFPPGINASTSYATRYNSTNLRFMTTEQALADLAYFAQHVSFPGLASKILTAPGTPGSSSEALMRESFLRSHEYSIRTSSGEALLLPGSRPQSWTSGKRMMWPADMDLQAALMFNKR